MNELTLHGQVPHHRHTQLQHILSGVTAMPPLPLTERHILFKPTRTPVRVDAKDVQGGTQAVAAKKKTGRKEGAREELWMLRLVERVVDDDDDDDAEDVENGNEDRDSDASTVGHPAEIPRAKRRTRWEIQWRDLPEAGASAGAPTNRSVESMQVDTGDPVAVVEGMGYAFAAQHLVCGHRFTHHATDVVMYRVVVPVAANQASRDPRVVPDDPGGGSLEDQLRAGRLGLLDQSGGYMLEARVLLEDGKDPNVIQRGVRELMGLKERLRGVVDLRSPDRLTFDTRVR